MNRFVECIKMVMHYFTMACKKKGASVLIVTHDAKVASYCDKVIFLCNGRIGADHQFQGWKYRFIY